MKINEAELAEMCGLAYSDPVDLYDTKLSRFNSLQGFQQGGTECVVLGDNGTVIVVVRGSQKNWMDWFANFQFFKPAAAASGRVHRGFRRSADRLDRAGLWDYIDALYPHTIWFAGHSMGGAIAAVLANDACANTRPCAKNLFTIGQPRTGTVEWSGYLSNRITNSGGEIHRFVDPMDVVPHLPPAGRRFLPDYWHHGATHMITADSKLIPNAAVSESIVATAYQAATSPHKVWKAHSCQTYIASLKKWVQFRNDNNLSLLIEHDTQPEIMTDDHDE